MTILRRNSEDRFSTVTREWDGVTAVLLGGGPSLCAEQIELVRQAREADAVRVIAINDAFLVAPWADVCYAADSKWHTWMKQGIAKPKLRLSAAQVRERWAQFRGQKCGIESAQPYLADDVHVLKVTPHDVPLSRDPRSVATGRSDGYMGHGGFQALNIALLAGAETVILLGFDGGPSTKGETHFHGGHAVPTPAPVWDYIRRSFSAVENEIKAAGVRVLNSSPGSAIDTFPKICLEEALAARQVAA